jgi:hypothetical protein
LQSRYATQLATVVTGYEEKDKQLQVSQVYSEIDALTNEVSVQFHSTQWLYLQIANEKKLQQSIFRATLLLLLVTKRLIFTHRLAIKIVLKTVTIIHYTRDLHVIKIVILTKSP